MMLKLQVSTSSFRGVRIALAICAGLMGGSSLQAETSATGSAVVFVVEHDISALCGSGTTGTGTKTRYEGRICGGAKVRWDSMTTLNPREGLTPEECSWRRGAVSDAWDADWVGDCGVAPKQVAQLPTVTTLASHELRPLCGNGGAGFSTQTRYWGRACQPDGRIRWDSMTTLNPRAGLAAEACSWRRGTVSDAWDAEWVGGCGVAPGQLAGLPTRTSPPVERVRGIADLHNHQMNHLGFGGRALHGDPFGPLASALPYCTAKHGTSEDRANFWWDGAHHHGGNPGFEGWPAWDSLTHQQVYEDWLKRAHDGGLRLIVMLAGHNRHICRLNAASAAAAGATAPHVGCDGMAAIYSEIAAAKKMDQERDWYEIVYTPQQARRVIHEGKLAVVLGTEIPYLFDCGTATGGGATDFFANIVQTFDPNADLSRLGLTTNCSESQVRQGLANLHAAGVRHLFPIHNSNNGFGGSALYNFVFRLPSPEFNVPWARDCSSEGYQWGGGCNLHGLSDLGKFFATELMKKGMMIDIDHASHRSKQDLLAIAETNSYPLVSSHTGFLDISTGASRRHEGNMRAAELERIRRLGGVIAPIVVQGEASETLSYQERIAHSCGQSAESFAQAYLYLKDKMKGRSVPIGSDFNGFAGLPGPRFRPTGLRLESHHGNYVKALDDGSADVKGLETQPGALFELIDVNGSPLLSGDKVHLRNAKTGKFLTAEGGGGGSIVANRTAAAEWETFVIQRMALYIARGIRVASGPLPIDGDDWVSFRASNGQYVAAEGGGNGALVANRGEAKEWETFILKGYSKGCHQLGQKPTVEYPFTSSLTGETFDRQKIGSRTLDINFDGMNNVGLLPDFVEELKKVGLTDQDLEPLYNGAEGYIATWERADAAKLELGGGVQRVPIAGELDGVDWKTAARYCAARSKHLASSREICPSGPGGVPAFGQPAGDVWMAVADHPNAWVSVGTSYPDRLCKLHEHLGGPPSWGTDRGPEPVTGQPAALKCLDGYSRVPIASAGGSFNWRNARDYCAARNLRLATLAEICPQGPAGDPVYGKPAGDVWMAVGDRDNAWVSIGTSYSERRCRFHEELGSAPSWGLDRGPEPHTGQSTALLCRTK